MKLALKTSAILFLCGIFSEYMFFNTVISTSSSVKSLSYVGSFYGGLIDYYGVRLHWIIPKIMILAAIIIFLICINRISKDCARNKKEK